jgi:hypothetical protein
MLTPMTGNDWAKVLRVFAASCFRRGAKGRGDRRFLEVLHSFTVHDTTWRARPSTLATGARWASGSVS